MNIFEDIAPKLYERGLSVIPIDSARKAPVYNEWSKFCEKLADKNEFNFIKEKYPKHGIGLCCGPASNIIAVDFDYIGPERDYYENKVRDILPPALIEKRGNPEKFTIFYKYNPEVVSRKLKWTNTSMFIEILSQGNQTVIPPTMHPTTKKPYFYTHGNLDEIRDIELPELTLEHVSKLELLRDEIKSKYSHLYDDKAEQGGRNEKLKSMVVAALAGGDDEQTIINSIVKYDNNFEKPLFSDSSEGYRVKSDEDIIKNATKFVRSITKSVSGIELKPYESDDKYRWKKNGFYQIINKTKADGSKSESTYELPDYNGLSDYIKDIYFCKSSGAGLWMYKDNKYDLLDKLKSDKFINSLTGRKAKPEHLDKFYRKIMADIESIPETENNGFINLKNGILDINNNKIIDHDPKYFFKYKLDHSFDANKKCDAFIKFLDFIFQGDQQSIDLTSEIFGYCMQGGHPWLHKGFVLYGEGRNGKSTFMDILRHLIGFQNVSQLSLSALDKPFSVVSLDGKLANICDETPSDKVNPELFKIATSGGSLRASFKGRDEYDLTINARFVFACNKPPKFNESTVGLLERLCFLKFDKYIEKKSRDALIKETILKNDMSGIINFALDGLRRLKSRGYLPETATHDDAMDEFRRESDSVYDWASDKIEYKENNNDWDSHFMYEIYKAYCLKNGRNPYGHDNFCKKLNQFLKEKMNGKYESVKVRIGNKRRYRHLVLVSDYGSN